MVGFGQGLGCGCCGVCDQGCQFTAQDRPHDPPQANKFFMPRSAFPLTEPFNNSGPVNSLIYTFHSPGSPPNAWATATVGDKLSPNKAAYSGLFTRIATVTSSVFLFTGQECVQLNASIVFTTESADSLPTFYAAGGLTIWLKSSSSSGNYIPVATLASDLNSLDTLVLGSAATVIETWPQVAGASHTRNLEIELKEMDGFCRATITVDGSDTVFDTIPENTLRCSCAAEIRLSAEAWSYGNKFQSTCDTLVIDPHL